MMPNQESGAPLGAPRAPLVAHVIVGLENGGAENMLERLVTTSQGRRKFRHMVISLTGTGPVGQRLIDAGIPVRALGMRSGLGAIAAFWGLRAMLRELHPDIVQTWMYHADLLGGLAARTLGIRRVIWGVRATFVEYEGSRITNTLVRVCAALSRRIPAAVVCAAEASRRAHEAFGYDAARLRVIPNGYDSVHLARAATRRSASRAMIGAAGDGNVVIGACGRFNPVKDFGSFIRAAAIVSQRLPSARFVLAGKGLDSSNAELNGWLDANGVANIFTLLGERPDLPDCLAAFDVFCLSSKSEGFPNVVCEAMGVGVPCAVTNVGDAALIVGDTGEVVPKEDVNALADAMLRIAQLHPDKRRALGERARARLEAEFSIDVACSRFESLYRELLASADVS